MILSSFGTAFAATETASSQRQIGNDIAGHWAETTLRDWVDKGFIHGFEDGSLKPDRAISRAEFVALANKSHGFTEQASISFKDVQSKDWFYADVAKAKAAGYISGSSDQAFKPTESITREQAAVIVARLLNLTESNSTGAFSDLADASAWSKGAIGAVIDAGLMVGDKGKFRPLAKLTRAEAVSLLQKALNQEPVFEAAATYDKAGTYGDKSVATTINGSVLISAPDVTLNNYVIEGDLLIGEDVGQGEVYLNKVTVKGNTTVLGGGIHSIHLNDSVLLTVIVNKKDGSIRIVAEGSTTVQQIELQSGARLEESQLTGSGFGDLLLSSTIPESANVSLAGQFETVDVIATSINLNLSEGSIQELMVAASASNSDINISAGAHIAALILNAVSNVSGQGTIGTATINASGSTIEQIPSTVNVGSGVNATVGGNPAVNTPTGSTSGPGGSGPSTPSVSDTVYGFSGTIRDVLNSPVPNVRIDFRRGTGATVGPVVTSVITNENGQYYAQLAPGIYTGELIGEGFITTYVIGVSLSDRKNTGQDATAIRIPDADEIRIVLTWGENPRDEDSHLLGPTPDGGLFHTWYADREFSVNNTVYADLDHDDTSSYGPETTTIRKRTDGLYQFYVHHFSGISTLRASGAKVEVYVGDTDTPSKVYQIPVGEGTEIYWDVFSMNILNGAVEFTERNTLSNSPPEYEGTFNSAALELAKFGSQHFIYDASVTGATYLVPNAPLTEGTEIRLADLQPTSVTSVTYATYLTLDPSGQWLNLNNLNTTGEPLTYSLLITAEINGQTASRTVSIIIPTVESQLAYLLDLATEIMETGQLEPDTDSQLQARIDAGMEVFIDYASTAEDYANAVAGLIEALQVARDTL